LKVIKKKKKSWVFDLVPLADAAKPRAAFFPEILREPVWVRGSGSGLGGCGGAAVIRKEAWPFYKTISGVRLWWELEEPKGPKGRVGGVGWLAKLGGSRVCTVPRELPPSNVF